MASLIVFGDVVWGGGVFFVLFCFKTVFLRVAFAVLKLIVAEAGCRKPLSSQEKQKKICIG